MSNSMSATTEIIQYFTTLPLFELLAVLTSIFYVVLAAKGNIWCWPAAIISTVLYTVIFYNVYLWMDSLLQLYYLLMAIYGWFCWHQNSTSNNSTETKALLYSQWSLNRHSVIILVLTLVSLALGWLMATYTPAHFPYLDSATTVFSVFATYLITQKVLENWLYFIVIDIVSIYLYMEKDLLPTAALFGSFVIFAAYGYWQWRKQFRLQFRQQHNDMCINSSVTE
ncbi:nicotinamide riboside transporter PnuC [Colwellia sp. Arc7-D]|uniref:nicotinamide riboside transporter PnuC n=1 Tax=Colwellia sp. Arc7-D TaxID=2161872 RepID=UPI001EF3B754|nr:nicotinamide riboside transporter PnuC [Colwellia sp. Arc7-D]